MANQRVNETLKNIFGDFAKQAGGRAPNIGENVAAIAQTSKTTAGIYMVGITMINVLPVVIVGYIALRLAVGHPVFSDKRL